MQRLTSRMSSGGRVTLPRRVREKLGLEPGDRLVYRYTPEGVLIEAARPSADDPFAGFSEWSSPEDEEAFADL